MCSILELSNIDYIYHTKEGETKALSNISFTLSKGEFVAIVGPSGCGKSTLLSLICGLLVPSGGSISFMGHPLQSKDILNMGYMLQKDHLLEWRTIASNVQLGLEIQHKMTPENLAYASRLLETYGLADFAAKRPSELSGGMRQRVAIARALANRPDVLLMDEPFGALDAHTRILLQRELLRIWQHHKTTILFVTHGVDEAVYLADRVVVMSARPGTVRAVVPVDIPRPRHRGDPEYARLTASILEMLDTSAGTGRDERKNDAGGCPCR